MFLSLFLSMFTHTLHSFFFFFNDTATTEIYTLSLHDALPISLNGILLKKISKGYSWHDTRFEYSIGKVMRSEEHTSELQSHSDLVCRLLLEKKKKKGYICLCGSRIAPSNFRYYTIDNCISIYI